MPPMTPIAELRELHAKATPGPWAYRPNQHDDWGYIRGAEVEMSFGPGNPIVAVAREGYPFADEPDFAKHREDRTDPYGPNALLIVAAVNALPALLDTIDRLTGERDALKAANDLLCEADQRVFQEINRADAAEQRCADIIEQCAKVADKWASECSAQRCTDTSAEDKAWVARAIATSIRRALAQTGRG